MKNIIIGGIMVLGLFAPQITQAQGTLTYLSNLDQTSTGSAAVGSDSWFGADFITGTNAGGYVLDSVQLAMADASGTPNDFTIMIYGLDPNINIAGFPGSSLGSLSGSLNPVTGGIFTYTAPSNLILLPNMHYFVVLTAGTATNTGAYEWSVTSTASPGYNSYHWGGEISFVHSSVGSSGSWHHVSGTFGQFAIDATAVPEPGVLSLLAVGGLGFLWHRRKAGAV